MILKQCSLDGCFAIVTPPETHCPRHQGVKAEALSRAKASTAAGWDRLHAKQDAEGTRALYRDPRWRRLRAAILKASPLCSRCGQPATEAHHRVMPQGNPEAFFDPGNLEAICKPCHLAESRTQRWDKWRAEP